MKYIKAFEVYTSINGYDYTEQELDYIKNNSKFQFDNYVKLNIKMNHKFSEITEDTVCKIIKINTHNYTDYAGKNANFFSYKIQDVKGNSDFFNQGFLDFATPEEIEQFKFEEATNKYNL